MIIGVAAGIIIPTIIAAHMAESSTSWWPADGIADAMSIDLGGMLIPPFSRTVKVQAMAVTPARLTNTAVRSARRLSETLLIGLRPGRRRGRRIRSSPTAPTRFPHFANSFRRHLRAGVVDAGGDVE